MHPYDFEKSHVERLLHSHPNPGSTTWFTWMQSFCLAFYNCYPIKKPNNRGTRWIEAPVQELKAVQRGLISVFDEIPRHPAAHGLDDKDYKKNAEAHLGSKQIFSLDLKDFYKNCTLDQVLNSFQTSKEKHLIHRYAKYIFYVDTTDKAQPFLPTGSPLSPIIANLAVTGLDRELELIAKKWGAVYTRYLDDMNFSLHAPTEISEEGKTTFMKEIVYIVQSFGWKINIRKTKWINPEQDAVVITGVDLRNQPKVTRRYIVNKMRPALNRTAIHLIRWNYIKKPFIHQGVESTLQLIQSLDPKLAGSLVYIKYVNEDQYKSLISYFEKRFLKALELTNKSFSHTVDWWKNEFGHSFSPEFLKQIEDRQKELHKSDLPAILTWKVAAAQVYQRKE